MWLLPEERSTLALVAAVALAGLAMVWWQRQHSAIIVTGASVAVVPWDTALATARQVDINTADVAELERLPEVGPALAGRIVAYRTTHGPFRSAEELTNIKGIGSKKLATLTPYVTIQGR